MVVKTGSSVGISSVVSVVTSSVVVGSSSVVVRTVVGVIIGGVFIPSVGRGEPVKSGVGG